MATIVSTQAMNIVEAQKREGYTNAAEFLANLVKKNDLLNFAPWFTSTDGAFHKWVEATRLGAGSFTKANEAVPSISSGSDTKVEPVAFYQADSTIDDVVLKTAKDKAKARDSEDVANLEGFTQNWMYQLMYGANATEGFTGLAARRAKLDSAYTFGAGGSGSDLTSLWLFEFGERGFNFRYPAGMQPGITSEDRGRHKVPVPTGTGTFWAWIRHFEIAAGMEIKNQKALLRLANIESGGTDISPNTFIKMKNQLPQMGRDAVGFCNRTAHALIETGAYNKTNAAYSIADIEGFGPVAKVVGIPIMFWEGILDTESAITA
ncbi:MAG: hypothetical protein EOM32_10630 [Spirochaetia bacterium]|nr:hypothetical protein [Spirochaetia bacterium]